MKAIYSKLTANIMLNSEKLKAFPLKSGIRTFQVVQWLRLHAANARGIGLIFGQEVPQAIWGRQKINKIRKGTKVPTLAILIQHSPSHSNQKRKRNKRNPNWKRSKTVAVDDMNIYSDNPNEGTRKLLDLINAFGKVAGCKINIQKLVAFLYANNERKRN